MESSAPTTLENRLDKAVKALANDQVFYTKELRNFLGLFVDEKGQPMPTRQALQLLQQVMLEKHGQNDLKPQEITRAVFEKILPEQTGEPNYDKNILISHLLSGMQRNESEGVDRLTGGYKKHESGLFTGLAHLRSLLTEQDVLSVEIDFSNMAGTNRYFKDLIREVEKCETPDEEANAYTDAAARALMGSVQQTIALFAKDYPDFGQHVLRSGGDEARMLITGLPEAHREALENRIHETIADKMLELGLTDHPHEKAGRDPGFGAAVHIMDLNDIQNDWRLAVAALPERPDDILGAVIKQVDDQIVANKKVVAKIITDNKGYFLTRKPSEQLAHLRQKLDVSPPEAKSLRTRKAVRRELFTIPSEQAKTELATKVGASQNPVVQSVVAQSLEAMVPMDPSTGTPTTLDMPEMIASFRDDLKVFHMNDSTRLTDRKFTDEERQKMAVRVMAIGFSGLGAINKDKGHDGADKVLQSFVKDVVKASFREVGLPSIEEAKQHSKLNQTHEAAYHLGHHGNGQFVVLLKPFYRKPDGTTFQLTDEKTVEKVNKLMAKKMEAFQAEYQKVQDPKNRVGNDGVKLTIAADVIDHNRYPPQRGGQIMNDIIGLLREKESDELVAREFEGAKKLVRQARAGQSAKDVYGRYVKLEGPGSARPRL